MKVVFKSESKIVMIQKNEFTMTIKDERHQGTLMFSVSEDTSTDAVLVQLNNNFSNGDLLLRIKGENKIRVSEGFDFLGNVQLRNVVLCDPILEDASLINVELPNTELSVRFASLENVPSYKRPKKITLAYGLYTGSDLCGSLDINRINGSNVRA